MVRDHLVCGVNDIRIQNQLLQEPNLTFDKALKLAQTVEAVAKNAADLYNASTSSGASAVQHLSNRPSRTIRKQISCYRCGGNHLANACRFQSVKCRACGKIGHIAKVCRSVTSKPQCRKEQASKKTSVHTVTTPSQTSDPPASPNGLETLFTLPGKVLLL